MPNHASLGLAIGAGLARFHCDEGCYVITPDGETWLSELEIHGLANAPTLARAGEDTAITDPLPTARCQQ